MPILWGSKGRGVLGTHLGQAVMVQSQAGQAGEGVGGKDVPQGQQLHPREVQTVQQVEVGVAQVPGQGGGHQPPPERLVGSHLHAMTHRNPIQHLPLQSQASF